MTPKESVDLRKVVQWSLWPIVVVVVALGWKYTWLGFSVPIVMTLGMIGGFLGGRYVCGNLCPRGSFFDRILSRFTLGKGIPASFRSMPLRLVLFALMMGFMVFQISRNPGDWRHWGYVFWLMCAVTTGIGVILGVWFHQRSWCAFCPMGTMQNLLGRIRPKVLLLDSAKCVECHRCEKVCPVQIPIVKYKGGGVVADGDCVQCDECIAVCPKSALSWRQKCDPATSCASR